MKVVFMGTPDFAASSLKALLNFEKVQVIAVYCQPDRPAGRGHKVHFGAVKKIALEQNLPIYQPQNFKDSKDLQELKNLGADIFIVAAYGLILPQVLLDLPPLGTINVHASLLPKYRGAAPIQRAVMNGDSHTGITIMEIVLALDSGDMLLQRSLAIGIDQTAGEVHDELAELGGRLVIEYLTRLKSGQIAKVKQDESKVSFAAKLNKEDGILNFRQTARKVHNQSRGVTPFPGARLTLLRQDVASKKSAIELIVEVGHVIAENEQAASKIFMDYANYTIGDVLPLYNGVLPIRCAEGLYALSVVRPAGKKTMSSEAFYNGYLKNYSAKVKV